jgi:hypothetical protein
MDCGPVGLNNTIHGCISVGAVGADALIAQNALECGTYAQDGRAATLIVDIGNELDADGAEYIETKTEHQELALAIDAGAPVIGMVPGPPYLEFAMLWKDVVKHGAANDGTGSNVYDGEWILLAGGALEDGGFEVPLQDSRVGAIDRDELPNTGIGTSKEQAWNMSVIEWDEFYFFTLQVNGVLYPIHTAR